MEVIKMHTEGFVYNCPVRCPIHKHCFIIKLEEELQTPLTVLKKCDAEKGKDIRIRIGRNLDGRDKPP